MKITITEKELQEHEEITAKSRAAEAMMTRAEIEHAEWWNRISSKYKLDTRINYILDTLVGTIEPKDAELIEDSPEQTK